MILQWNDSEIWMDLEVIKVYIYLYKMSSMMTLDTAAALIPLFTWANNWWMTNEWWLVQMTDSYSTIFDGHSGDQSMGYHKDSSACHFLPEAQMHTAPGRGHNLEVSLNRFIVSLLPRFLPNCIPTEPLIWAFIKWVHRHSAGAAALVSHRPSAGSKSSIYLCYEGHVERTMGVALRDALRDNCLTIPRDLW